MGNSLGEVFISLGFDVDDDKLKKFKDNLKDTQENMAKLGKTTAEAMGIITAAGTGLGLFVQHSADGAVKLNAMAQAWGANTQAAQTFANALHQVNSQIGIGQGQEMYGRFARLVKAGIPWGSAEASSLALLGGDYKAGMSVEEIMGNLAKNYDKVKKQLGPQYGAQIEKLLGSPYAESAIAERAHNPNAYFGASKYNTTDQTLSDLQKFASATAEFDEALHKFADSMAGEIGSKLVIVVEFLTKAVNAIGGFNDRHPGAATAEGVGGATVAAIAGGWSIKKIASLIFGGGKKAVTTAVAESAPYDAEAAWAAATGGGGELGFSIPGIGQVMALASIPWLSSYAGGKIGDYLKAKPGSASSGIASPLSSFTDAQKSGIMRALADESGIGLNPGAIGDHGTAYGIAQWHPDRQRNFERWAGHSIRGSSRAEQLAFVNFELTQGMERAAGDRIRKAGSADEAYLATKKLYERPAGSQNITLNVYSNSADPHQVAKEAVGVLQKEYNVATSQTNLGY